MSLRVYLVDTVSDPHVFEGWRRVVVGDYSIRYDVAEVLDLAGCYDALCESTGKRAVKIIKPLELAVRRMRDNPTLYRALDAPNKRGTYEQALPWLNVVLTCCKLHPNAVIEVIR